MARWLDRVVVRDHHHVLPVWADLCACSEEPPAVLSLDHHTDVCASPLPWFDWRDRQGLTDAVALLRHDEHFDCALRCGLVDAVSVIAHVCRTPVADARMAVICDPAWPEEQTILNPPEGLRPLADAVLTDAFLERQLAHLPWDWRKKPFILDVDLDYFLTRRAAHPVDSSVFRALIECAIGITISLEPEWVRLLAFPGETHTALDLLAILDGQFGPCGE